jgi:hypothetical protein
VTFKRKKKTNFTILQAAPSTKQLIPLLIPKLEIEERVTDTGGTHTHLGTRELKGQQAAIWNVTTMGAFLH